MSELNEGTWQRAASIYPDPRLLHIPDPESPTSWFNEVKAPIIGVFVFGGSPLTFNLIRKRPWYAGIHVTIGSAIAGAIGCTIFRMCALRYYTFRDQVYRHYVQLHPEDFPPPEKVLVGDVWQLWEPNR